MPYAETRVMPVKRIALSASFSVILAISAAVMSGTPRAVPVCAALSVGAFAAFLLMRRGSTARHILPVVIAAAVLSLLRFGIAYRLSHGDAQALLDTYAGQRVTCTGYAADDTAPNDTLYLKLSEIDGHTLPRKIEVYTRNGTADYIREGDALTFSAVLRQPKNGKNASFDFVRHLAFRGIYIELSSVREASVNTVCASRPSVGARMRRFVTSRLDKLLAALPASADYTRTFGITKALLYGDKASLSDADLEAFRRCGITHILCVSGMHFSVVFGMIALLLSFLTSNPAVRRSVLFVSIVLYLALCGFSLSAVRAAAMAAAGGFRGKSTSGGDGIYRLLLAASLILLVFPFAALDIGFHLSFLATLGIVCTASFIGCLPHLAADSADTLLRSVLSFLLVPIGAFLFTAPYSAAVFGGVSTVGLLVSYLTVYPAGWLLIAAWLGVLLGFPLRLLEPLAYIAASIMEALATFICRTAEHFAAWRYAYLPLTTLDHSLPIWLLAAFLAAVLNVHRGLRRTVFIAFAALVPLGIAAAALVGAHAA